MVGVPVIVVPIFFSFFSTRFPRSTRNNLRQFCVLGQESNELFKNAVDRLNLSARAYDRILKISRTIADLEGKENIEVAHISEGIQYRTLDRNNWSG